MNVATAFRARVEAHPNDTRILATYQGQQYLFHFTRVPDPQRPPVTPSVRWIGDEQWSVRL